MKVLICTIIFSFSIAVNAGEKTKDVDLKSAYCIKAQKDFLSIIIDSVRTDEDLKSILYKNPKNDNEIKFNQEMTKSNDERKEAIEKTKYLISRIEGYLNPRLKYLNKSAIISAINQVEKDRAFTESCMKRNNCNPVTEGEKFEACMSECNEKNGNISKKIDECSDLYWLPY